MSRRPKLMGCKELAAEISVRREWVCAAVKAGAPRVTKRLYDLEEFVAWLRANPDFTRREVYRGGRAEKKTKLRKGHRRGTPAVHF